MKIHCTIYGQGDEEQEVEIEFKPNAIGWWFSPDGFEITDLEIKSALSITPSDLHTDLQVGMALALYVSVDKVKIDCEPVEAVEAEMIFI